MLSNLKHIPVLLALLIIASCNSNSPKNLCNCKLSKNHKWHPLYLTASGDSILICKEGTVVRLGAPYKGDTVSWESALSDPINLMSQETTGRLTDCSTGEEIKTSWSWSYYVKFRDKKIITESVYTYDSLQPDGKWFELLERPVYREIFYAENGKFKKTEPELIINVPYYSPEAINDIHLMYYSRNKNKLGDNYQLYRRMLVAALNGDSLSRAVLLQYQADPQSEEGIIFRQRILRDYLVKHPL